MIIARLKYKCRIPGCNNAKNWYVIPLDKKTKSNDFVRSLTHYKLQCKKCGQNYILQFSIKLFRRKK